MYAVAAGYQRARFIHLVVSALEQRMHRIHGHLFGYGHYVQAKLGLAAHGVNVRKGVGGGYLAEKVRIVRYRREEVHRLHYRKLVAYLINGCVVALIEAHEKVRVVMHLYAVQQLRQHSRADLCAAARAFCQFSQFYIFACHIYSLLLRFMAR